MIFRLALVRNLQHIIFCLSLKIFGSLGSDIFTILSIGLHACFDVCELSNTMYIYINREILFVI